MGDAVNHDSAGPGKKTSESVKCCFSWGPVSAERIFPPKP